MTDRSPYRGSAWRQAALEKLRSPERLDALLPVTSSFGWLAVAALGLGVVTALLWGAFGVVVRTTTGEGILLRDSGFGIVEVSGGTAGKIAQIDVYSGDIVRAGQPVARLELPQLEEQIKGTRETLDSLSRQTSNPDILHRQIIDQQARLRELQALYDRTSVIRVSQAGRVTEVAVSEGNFVSPGRTILRLESLNGDYEAVVYVSAADGKRIRPGMSVRLAPSTVNPEESGVLMAQVKFVSGYPVTRDYLLSEMGGDERLVDKLLENGSVIEVVVALEKDPSTPSGFRWTSPNGPDVSIESGTLCRATIVLSRARPFTLLLPWLKSRFGLY